MNNGIVDIAFEVRDVFLKDQTSGLDSVDAVIKHLGQTSEELLDKMDIIIDYLEGAS